ncbi:MAG: dTMP kinase [Parvularculaceae bacterium]|nr:dTMP kinase [Parvularculaceae bacterium]
MTAEARRGAFISFEGGDGAGKTTQIARLADRLRRAGRDVVTTREPGGAPGAEEIRALLVSGAADRWTPLGEALLMYAARAEHLARTILPARARGAIVLTDRFSDSTRAYQGIAGSLGRAPVDALEALVVGGDAPDLTFILDAGEAGLARAGARGGDDRFERKGAEYQARVREAFLAIAHDDPRRCVVIDSRRSADEVAADIARHVEARLGLA